MTFDNRGVFGYDISKWQDAPDTAAIVDFQKMKSTGAAFVIIRVGQGNFIDREWHRHKINSRGILPRAAYWYFDPRYDPQLQAAMCAAAIGSERLEGRVWLDLEFDWPGTFHASHHWRTFQDLLKGAGFRTGVYTRQTWWEGRGADMGYWGGEPFWLAQYNDVLDLIPSGLRIPPMLWQDRILTTGHEAGVESAEIDRDIWNSQYSFASEWGAQPPQEPGEPMEQIIKGTALTAVNRRDAPAGNLFSPPRYLQPGDTIEADRNQFQWLHLTAINGVSIASEEWASAGASQQYIRWAWEDVAEPPVEPTPTEPTLTHTIQVYSNGSIKVDGNPVV